MHDNDNPRPPPQHVRGFQPSSEDYILKFMQVVEDLARASSHADAVARIGASIRDRTERGQLLDCIMLIRNAESLIEIDDGFKHLGLAIVAFAQDRAMTHHRPELIKFVQGTMGEGDELNKVAHLLRSRLFARALVAEARGAGRDRSSVFDPAESNLRE